MAMFYAESVDLSTVVGTGISSDTSLRVEQDYSYPYIDSVNPWGMNVSDADRRVFSVSIDSPFRGLSARDGSFGLIRETLQNNI